jgi:hypothetical protein
MINEHGSGLETSTVEAIHPIRLLALKLEGFYRKRHKE